jgi:hypothetical protein
MKNERMFKSMIAKCLVLAMGIGFGTGYEAKIVI